VGSQQTKQITSPKKKLDTADRRFLTVGKERTIDPGKKRGGGKETGLPHGRLFAKWVGDFRSLTWKRKKAKAKTPTSHGTSSTGRGGPEWKRVPPDGQKHPRRRP